MIPKLNIGKSSILISAIILIISVLIIIDRLLATGPVQLMLSDGKAVPIEGASFFSINEVLLFIITAWLGGMSFIYIILNSKEIPELKDEEIPVSKREIAGIPENKSTLAATLLEGDEKVLFQNVLDNDGILQRELITKTGFSEPKVSRLLDKAERKGLIIRQRDGMGNRIFLR